MNLLWSGLRNPRSVCHSFLLLLGGADNERSDIVTSGIVVLGVRAIAGGESARQPAPAVNTLLACLEDSRYGE